MRLIYHPGYVGGYPTTLYMPSQYPFVGAPSLPVYTCCLRCVTAGQYVHGWVVRMCTFGLPVAPQRVGFSTLRKEGILLKREQNGRF